MIRHELIKEPAGAGTFHGADGSVEQIPKVYLSCTCGWEWINASTHNRNVAFERDAWTAWIHWHMREHTILFTAANVIEDD